MSLPEGKREIQELIRKIPILREQPSLPNKDAETEVREEVPKETAIVNESETHLEQAPHDDLLNPGISQDTPKVVKLLLIEFVECEDCLKDGYLEK